MCFVLDIDECARGVATCDPRTTYCANKFGSYGCYCNSGLKHVTGDSKTCQGEETCFIFNPVSAEKWLVLDLGRL